MDGDFRHEDSMASYEPNPKDPTPTSTAPLQLLTGTYPFFGTPSAHSTFLFDAESVLFVFTHVHLRAVLGIEVRCALGVPNPRPSVLPSSQPVRWTPGRIRGRLYHRFFTVLGISLAVLTALSGLERTVALRLLVVPCGNLAAKKSPPTTTTSRPPPGMILQSLLSRKSLLTSGALAFHPNSFFSRNEAIRRYPCQLGGVEPPVGEVTFRLRS